MLNINSTGIKVNGHIGRWYVIDQRINDDGSSMFLLEHEEYGDEAACVIVDKDGNLLMDDVWNGFYDWDEHLEYMVYGEQFNY